MTEGPEAGQLLVEGGPVLVPAGVVQDGAVLAVGGRIVAAGERREVVELAGSLPGGVLPGGVPPGGSVPVGPRRVIDAAGGSILPGFVDAHAHPLSTSLLQRPGQSVRYPEIASIAELVAAVARFVAQCPAGSWVRSRGFDHGKYPDGRMPTRWDLDAVSPDHPVALVHASGHFALVNSRALREAGIGDDVEDPVAGAFVRDAAGRPTGMLLDSAMQLVLPSLGSVGSHGPSHNNFPAEPAELAAQLADGLRAFADAGVTTVADAQMMARDLPVYLDAWRRGALPIRVVGMFLSNHLDALEELGLLGPFGDDRFALGAIKVYCDGSLSGRTALFADGHGHDHGTAYWSAEELTALVGRAHRLGFQVGIHAQGDAAIGRCLDAIEAALRERPCPDHRHRIEHSGAPTREQIRRMADLGVVPVAQPAFLTQFGDNLLEHLGPERAARVHPLASYRAAGIPVALSSDSPVSSHRPLDAIQSAVHRRSTSGRPLGPEEELTVVDAVRAHTRDAARALFRERSLGELRPGHAADITVTARDLFAAAPDALAESGIAWTIVAGEVVRGAGARPSS